MLFNSFAFAVFLPLVFALYWSIFNRKDVRMRNLFLIIAGYVFYGWWDWRFLSLIMISSTVDFLLGKKLGKINALEDAEQDNEKLLKLSQHKRNWLLISILVNISFLGFFKYFNFFTGSFVALFSALGISISTVTLKIVLPVGISFYTFQSLSYTIDVYRRQCEPTKSWLQFFAFVSFFPQLVAGPIERAKNLLPQYAKIHKPDYEAFRSGLMQAAWGFFKKIMIADRLSVFVDKSFGDIPAAHGFPMIVAVVFFALQLYLDFSAYSDIAIGTAKLFGFNLMANFNRPYLSASFNQFWKRWHISLSSWFRDYVYIPLGGNRKGNLRTKINIMIVFLLSGLWHGASWNFVIWGALNGLFIIFFDKFIEIPKDKTDSIFARVWKSALIVFCWTASLVFFRAQGFAQAIDVFQNISFANINNLYSFGLNKAEINFSLFLIIFCIIKSIIWEKNEKWFTNFFFKLPLVVRYLCYVAFVLSIIFYGQYGGGNENSFIYFQF